MFPVCRTLADAKHQPSVLFTCAKVNGTQPELADTEKPDTEAEELE